MTDVLFHTLPQELQEQILRVAGRAPSLGITMSRPIEIKLVVSMAPEPKEGPDLLWLPGKTLDDVRRETILRAVARNGGSKKAAARELGVSRSLVVKVTGEASNKANLPGEPDSGGTAKPTETPEGGPLP